MSDKSYDVMVIGGGPGGYVAAIRAAQLGLKTACVEGRGTLGGTCLNIGCIPSKALLQASEKYEEAEHHLADFGIKTGKVALDMKGLMAHKDSVVEANVKGVEFLFKKNKVDWLKGWGALTAKPGEITVTGEDGKAESVSAKNVIIATGSTYVDLPNVTKSRSSPPPGRWS